MGEGETPGTSEAVLGSGGRGGGVLSADHSDAEEDQGCGCCGAGCDSRLGGGVGHEDRAEAVVVGGEGRRLRLAGRRAGGGGSITPPPPPVVVSALLSIAGQFSMRSSSSAVTENLISCGGGCCKYRNGLQNVCSKFYSRCF